MCPWHWVVPAVIRRRTARRRSGGESAAAMAVDTVRVKRVVWEWEKKIQDMRSI